MVLRSIATALLKGDPSPVCLVAITSFTDSLRSPQTRVGPVCSYDLRAVQNGLRLSIEASVEKEVLGSLETACISLHQECILLSRRRCPDAILMLSQIALATFETAWGPQDWSLRQFSTSLQRRGLEPTSHRVQLQTKLEAPYVQQVPKAQGTRTKSANYKREAMMP